MNASIGPFPAPSIDNSFSSSNKDNLILSSTRIFRVNYKEIIEIRKNCLKAEDVKRTHLDQHSNREGA